MNAPGALTILLDYALAGAPEGERLHVFDAAASLGQYIAGPDRARLIEIAAEAANVAQALRDTDRLQMRFRKLLA